MQHFINASRSLSINYPIVQNRPASEASPEREFFTGEWAKRWLTSDGEIRTYLLSEAGFKLNQQKHIRSGKWSQAPRFHKMNLKAY
jgi:hypothetical protein